MNKSIIVVVVLLLAVAGGGYFYLNSNNKSTRTTDVTKETSQVVEAVDIEGVSVKEFTVAGHNFDFQPTEIKVKKGETVKITFKDEDGTHDLVVDGYNVRTNIIKGGSQDSVTFVADKTGQFEYYCSVGNHKESGMTGTLIVE